MQIRVLGPVTVIGTDGRVVVVGSKRRRELLGRLVAAGGRVVSLEALIDDLWEDPPAGAVGAVRTFVSELRNALGADAIATVGRGYALRTAEVDVWRFEEAVRGGSAEASVSWGEPYADLDPSPWVVQERARLEELRSQAVELRARALLDQNRGASLVAELAEFAGAHPWREKAQVLLAHALYQDGRQVEALSVLREARGRLVDRFGLDAVPDLDRAEAGILRHAVTRTGGTYTRLRSASVVAGVAALTGDVGLAQAQRFAAVAEAERLGDPLLTARVLSAYDVPSNWTISDDEPRARALAETARRTLQLLPDSAVALRARVLGTIAVEHRGTRDRWAFDAAAEADRLARELGDPAVLVALNARFMQSFQQPGRSRERAVIAAELIEVAARHELPAYEILGHLVAIQAQAALGAFDAAEPHAQAAEQLAKIHETPLVHVFTRGLRIMRAPDEASYRELADEMSGMHGVATGFLPLALLSMRLRHGLPAPADPELDWGPYRPWAQPLLHLAGGDVAAARRAAARLPTPRADHYYEVLWAVAAHIAELLGDRSLAARARAALGPARGEIIGGTTAMMTFGSVGDVLRQPL